MNSIFLLGGLKIATEFQFISLPTTVFYIAVKNHDGRLTAVTYLLKRQKCPTRLKLVGEAKGSAFEIMVKKWEIRA